MKKSIRISILSLLLLALLPLLSCEAGLTSNDSSKDSSEKFSFSELYSSIHALQEEVKNLKSVIEAQDGEIFALQNRSNIGDIYFNDGNVDIGTIDQGANLRVYGDSRVDGSLTMERSSYKIIKNILTFIHPEQGYTLENTWDQRYYHIRTPGVKGEGAMYRYDLKGYSYGIGKAFSFTWCGYLFDDTGITKAHQIDSAGNGIPVSQYIGSDDHLYLKFGPISQYYNTFSLDFQGFPNIHNGLITLSSEDFKVIVKPGAENE
ncbi:MAG: hypothetical protein GY754_29600 [bacterium]|nr:hypothetical protein [bacterium]